MERFQERALVLSHLDYGDADRLVPLFTATRGQLTPFAAEAPTDRRRFRGAREAFTLIQGKLAERHGDTLRLDGADVEEAFFAIRQDLSLIARALYCLELCRELVRDREPHPGLFELLLGYLGLLNRK